MKIIIGLFLAAIMGFATTFSQSVAPATPSPDSDSVTVARLVHQWTVAFTTKDVESLDRIMADDFITTNVDGSVNTKQQEIAPFKTPDLVFDSATLDSVSITLYGNTAIVRGVGTFVGSAKWGSFNSRERFTDIFLKRNGIWQAVSSHSSSLRKK